VNQAAQHEDAADGVSRADGFILTRQWQDGTQAQDLVFWLITENGPLKVTMENQPAVFFIADSARDQVVGLLSGIKGCHLEQIKLKTFTEQELAVACYFRSQRDLHIARSRLEESNVPVFEADLRPTDRFLMERFVTGAASISGEFVKSGRLQACINPRVSKTSFTPSLRVVSLDIETSITTDVVLSIALYARTEETEVRLVFLVSDGEHSSDNCVIESCRDERTLLLRMLQWFEEYDPDVVIGWNVVGFDLTFLQTRFDALGVGFSLGRAGEQVRWRSGGPRSDRRYALVPGRVVLDGIELLRTATYSFESFSLEFVAQALLGKGKLVNDVDSRAAEIEDMYANDKIKLAEYNLQDCELVWDIFDKTDLIDFAVERSRLTGLDMDRPGGSVAAFDFLYLPRLHREGFVAPQVGSGDDAGSPGGFVLESRAGLYDDVVVLDFKSLYPSIIRTFHVDPLAMITAGSDDIEGFRDARFSRTRTLLPQIIENLWQARDAAKKHDRAAMSQAIKIIMNSFYGVLGTPACRFFDARLASSITLRGHEILQKTRDLIEEKGFAVIYGDTDSVFVHLRDVTSVADEARELVRFLNDWWRTELRQRFEIESYLEVEYETHFQKFLMPTMRGSEKGSKKRYAGMVTEDGRTQMVFKGLETVRSDWSPLARSFQQELYRLVFLELPFEDYVKSSVAEVLAGERDDELVLRRRMRRKIHDYVKNVPPHVRAARMYAEIRAEKGLPPHPESGGWIEYVMTVNGPEPKLYLSSPIDYDFYVERQLKPIADAILGFRHTSLSEITDRQLALF
jgi:DNA polymerase II